MMIARGLIVLERNVALGSFHGVCGMAWVYYSMASIMAIIGLLDHVEVNSL